MSEVKQVKVDNWGVYFLQRLKHFFNRTDFCDLTLQFQDNAQLKVHRLVLSACTEYFELLERTCEMYEDCLVMPDDLQADVVVPIVNFMYTGQLEFRMDLLDKLHQTSEIMSMPVLTKLLDSHRPKPKVQKITQSYSAVKRAPKRAFKETVKEITPTEIITTAIMPNNTSKTIYYRDKKVYLPLNRQNDSDGNMTMPLPLDNKIYTKKVVPGDPRPTRYELPEELDTDNIFESSFCNISYTSQPLMVHPDTQKQYSKRPRLIGDPATSKRMGLTTVDIVECKKPQEDTLFEESLVDEAETESELFPQPFENVKVESPKDTNLLFDQILEQPDEPSKFDIEKKSNQSVTTIQKPVSENLDHAKIISEVLKKYPHLVKSNKNIKLKIFNTPTKGNKKAKISPVPQQNTRSGTPVIKQEKEPDYTFETDVIDSKQAAKLIALGAENVDGPWICLICGTPGKAMNFTSYYKFRRHLVEVHNEKPVLNMCEYCGQRSTKRNYLLHHMYTKHGVEPPSQIRFPKCNYCNYIALTESLLIRHKVSHNESKNFRCNVCPSAFNSSKQLMTHIQNTGHKYSSEKKTNLQCIYCQKIFMREGNLCAHLKAYHRSEAIKDNIIDDSEDEIEEKTIQVVSVKTEPKEFEELDIQYQIKKRPDGNIQVIPKKTQEQSPSGKQKILNSGYVTQPQAQKTNVVKASNPQIEYVQVGNEMTNSHGEIIMIDNNEYILRENQLIPRDLQSVSEEFIISEQNIPNLTTEPSMEYTNLQNQNIQGGIQQPNILLKNSGQLSQQIPIYVSNETEYKALIASNQSIIVDNSDSSKMLTVITPHTSSLETTSVELDNGQSNDMMIIQDNFPINATEAVTTDNSNIVVVYSQQVGDQNKQFQLITSQGLGTQFVQSSTILTQNYETITTATPVINAPTAEDKQEMWQNNIHQILNTSELEVTPVASNTVDINQTPITNPVESESHVDLSHVQLNSKHTEADDSSTIISQDVITEEPNHDDTLKYINAEDQISNMEIVTSMEVTEEIPITEQTTDETNKVTSVDDKALKTPMEIEDNELPVQQMETEVAEETANEQEGTQIINENLIQPKDINISNQILEKNSAVSEPVLSDIHAAQLQEFVSEDISEENQLDTSMVSEEGNSDQVNETQEINPTPEINPTLAETAEELEESIENIQQEVDKQISNAPPSPSKYNEEDQTVTNAEPSAVLNDTAPTEDLSNTVSSQEESDHEENVLETVKPIPVEAQEKISSLLNDWDDSQEDNSGNENVPTESEEAVKSPTVEPDLPTESTIDNKQDKIKSLVSDWDEDEEENKE